MKTNQNTAKQREKRAKEKHKEHRQMQRLTLSHSHTNLIKHKIRTPNIGAKYLYGFLKRQDNVL